MGVEVVAPEETARAFVHDAIYRELVLGRFDPATKSAFIDILVELRSRGAQGVVLGCTEIPLLLKQEDCDLPIFDTLAIHASAAVDFALGGEEP
jgi:aspartate racemase